MLSTGNYARGLVQNSKQAYIVSEKQDTIR